MTIELLMQIGTIAGAAGAITYWGGRIARGSETLGERVGELAQSVQSLAHAHGEHGERLARVEAKIEAVRR